MRNDCPSLDIDRADIHTFDLKVYFVRGTMFFSASHQSKPGPKDALSNRREAAGTMEHHRSCRCRNSLVLPLAKCSRCIVVRSIMSVEGVTLPRIAVDRRVWFARKCRLDLSCAALEINSSSPRCISRGAEDGISPGISRCHRHDRRRRHRPGSGRLGRELSSTS